jgi:steroid delta-isomerase-like uncharacterized protein
MSVEDNKALARRFYEAIMTEHRLELAEEIFASDYVDHDPGNQEGTQTGASGARDEVAGYLEGMPDMSITIEDILAEGDLVAMRGVLRGTHQGPLFGIPPTGKPIEVGTSQIFRVANGKIAEGWLELDRLALLQQLGVIPPNPQGEREF